ncbi:MAG: hypothetical protein [Microviridae sp.]|nr:MAG: hypothetical protein [Microviridae sp.]
MLIELIVVLHYLKGVQNETPQNVREIVQETVLKNRFSYPSEKRHGCEHCHAGRHPSVMPNALLPPDRGLPLTGNDHERQTCPRLQP